ncbi:MULTISPECIES: hypothetical protein [unclassified Streptomyces]|uniref:hypothetical protein n=1 Tax=unclassified Streptomyces TaxID=2593676 RepID=UPI003249C928
MLKSRGTQRTDSTHILSAARELTRLELVTEAVRAVLEAMAHHAPEVLDELDTAEWAERYGRPSTPGASDQHPGPGCHAERVMGEATPMWWWGSA